MASAKTKTRFEEARETLLQGAKEVKYPQMKEMGSCLTTDVPSEQFAALQASLRALAEHTGKWPLIAQSAIFKMSINPQATLARQKACVRSVANEVPGLVTVITKQEEKAAAGGPPTDEKKPGPENGDQPPKSRFSERQWLHIVYAPQLRHRLLDEQLNPRCQALGVDLMSPRYPHNMDVAKLMSEQEIAAAFADLDRMAMQFLNAPSLHDAVRLNESVNDAQQEGFTADLLGHVDNSLRAEAEILLKMEDELKRLKRMMNDNSVTAALVASLLEAYTLVIQAQKPAAATGQSPPTRPQPQPALAVSGTGQGPRLPRRGPVRSSVRESHQQPARAGSASPTQGEERVDQNQATAAEDQPTIDFLKKEVADLRRQLAHTERRGQEVQQSLTKENDHLKQELRTRPAQPSAAAANAPRGNTVAALGVVVILVCTLLFFALIMTVAANRVRDYWATPAQPVQQSEPAETPPVYDFSDV